MKKALVLSLAVVLGLGVASFAEGVLSGSWDTTITIVPSPVSLAIDSELIVTYAVSGWAFTSDTVLDETGWLGQTFDATGALGAFVLGSTLDFTPYPAAFNYWLVTGGVAIVGVTFDATFGLSTNNTAFDLLVSGKAGLVTVSAEMGFGDPIFDINGNLIVYAAPPTGDGCDFDWQGITIDVGFPFNCATVATEIVFTCAGFDYAKFIVTGIEIPNLPWVSLNAELEFTVQTKTLVLKPIFDFGAIVCFDLYLTGLHTDGMGGDTTSVIGLLSDIQFKGIGLGVEFGGVAFEALSWWGASTANDVGHAYSNKPGLLHGTPYWEAYQIATTDDGCCGPFAFDVTVYFLQGGPQLFDVSKFVANMEIQIATQFTFATGISIDLDHVGGAFTNWTIGFLVEW